MIFGSQGNGFQRVGKWGKIVFGESREGWVLTDELEEMTSNLQGVEEGVQSGSVNQGKPSKQRGSGHRGPSVPRPPTPKAAKGVVKYWTDVLKLLLYYLTLGSVSLINNPENSEMNFCENMKLST